MVDPKYADFYTGVYAYVFILTKGNKTPLPPPSPEVLYDANQFFKASLINVNVEGRIP